MIYERVDSETLARALALLTLGACVIVGCSQGGGDAPSGVPGPDPRGATAPAVAAEQPAGPEPTTPSDESLAAHMGDHFAHASAVKQAVIDGDLEESIAAAQWIVDHHAQPGPPEWKPHLDALKSSARAAVAAKDLQAAAAAAGGMILACGQCHASLGKGPEFTLGTAPTDRDGANHMLRHQWAADRMFDGIVGNDDASWKTGAEALAEAPMEPKDLDANKILPPEVLQLRERAHAIGAEAARTTAKSERARLYGELLSTCAGCHAGAC